MSFRDNFDRLEQIVRSAGGGSTRLDVGRTRTENREKRRARHISTASRTGGSRITAARRVAREKSRGRVCLMDGNAEINSPIQFPGILSISTQSHRVHLCHYAPRYLVTRAAVCMYETICAELDIASLRASRVCFP